MSLNKKIFLVVGSLTLAVCLRLAPWAIAADDHASHTPSQAVVYSCPMHPQVTSDKPGDCPICHMRLVPNAASKSGDAVSVEPSVRNQLGIRVYQVEEKPLRKDIEAWGRIAHDPELYQAQIDYIRSARLWYERERNRTPLAQKRGLTDIEKAEIKFFDMGLSPDWIRDLENTRKPDPRLLYHEIADGVWVYLQLREKEAGYVKRGDEAAIEVTGLQNTKLKGKIEYVDSKVDNETGTIRARVLVLDPPHTLKPEMAVNARITVTLAKSPVIPDDAPLFTGEKALVFVEQGGEFKAREVVLGARQGGYIQVKDGLMPGEKVAFGGNFFIDSESRIRSAIDSASHGGHSS